MDGTDKKTEGLLGLGACVLCILEVAAWINQKMIVWELRIYGGKYGNCPL